VGYNTVGTWLNESEMSVRNGYSIKREGEMQGREGEREAHAKRKLQDRELHSIPNYRIFYCCLQQKIPRQL